MKGWIRCVSIPGVFGVIALVGLNAAFGVFFALWSIADGAAINNMERASGYDPAVMLPSANLMWIAGYVSLLLLLIVDGCAATWCVKQRRMPRRASK